MLESLNDSILAIMFSSLLPFGLIALYCASCVHTFKRKIVGGLPTTIEEYPYMSYLRVRFVNSTSHAYASCGATILDAYTLVTAGHCVIDPEYRSKFVDGTARVGSTYKMEGGQLVEVADGVIHPEYNMNTLVNDIGIIKLKIPIAFSVSASPAALGYKLPEVGAMMDIVGWGAKIHQGPTMPTLFHSQIPMFNKRYCQVIYASLGFSIPRNTFCAGFLHKAQDTCEGDSGGPIFYNKQLMGIVSWGDGCAKEGRVGVYTDVTQYRDFIEANMSGF